MYKCNYTCDSSDSTFNSDLFPPYLKSQPDIRRSFPNFLIQIIIELKFDVFAFFFKHFFGDTLVS